MRNFGTPGRGVDLPFLIRRAAWSYGESVAADDGARVVTIAEAVARGERVANSLDATGLPAGAPIGLLSENRVEYVEADLAIALARRVRVALNARLHLEDHRFVAADSGMRALVHSARYADAAAALREEFGLRTICFDREGAEGGDVFEDLVERGTPTPVERPGAVEDAAWITYTSGTTGRPKGIVLSHRSIREVAFNLLLEFGPVAPHELLVLTQPLSHGSGYFVLPWLISGAGVYVMRRFDPEETFVVSERPNVRVLKCVPAMLPPLMEMAEGRHFGYDSVIYGASPIPRPVLTAALERFGPVLAQVYGQSEAPVTITCLQPRDHVGDGDQRFSAGRPFRTVGVEVRDEAGRPLPAGEKGEVAVTGSHLMTGYLGLDDATSEVVRDGWIMTRDIGTLDERGFLYLLGRSDEMINSGGYNISPREVEEVLSQFPGVEEVAVVGLPDGRWGSVVSAAVRLRAGAPANAEELIEFARPRLTFRAPKSVTFVDVIPKTPYGKIDRSALLASLEPVADGAL